MALLSEKRSFRTLFTQRLKMCIPIPKFATRMCDYLTSNKAFFSEWIPLNNHDYYTINTQKQIIREKILLFKQEKEVRFVLMEKDKPEIIIGDIGFSNIIKGAFLSCYLSYKLDKNKLGLGYMTEALETAIPFIFTHFGLHRIEANIMPCNKASMRLVEKLGFLQEGVAKDYLKINDTWQDHVHMVLLNHKL